MNNVKEQALQYLAKGFSIIPVGANKKPLLNSWKEFQERRATAEEIDAWFSNNPDANVGIVTGKLSGVCVVDFDKPEAFDNAKDKIPPGTPLVQTGRGFHAYFKYQDGVRNFQKRADLPDVDLRAEGGYVIAPPSVHENGHVYKWLNGPSIDEVELPQLPDWVLAKDESEKTPINELEKGVSKGERNNALARLTGHWLGQGLSLEQCIEKALAWNQKNNPPMPETEVRNCTQSIFDKHQRENGTAKFDSNANSLSIAIEKKYITIDQIKNTKSPNVDWIWTGYLAKGHITLLSGLPKAGKTTLLFQLIRSIEGNQAFLELATKLEGKILIVSEENSQHYKVRVEKYQLIGKDVFILPAYEMDCSSKDKVLEQIRYAIDKDDVSLVVLDTLGEFWGVSDENNASAVQEALKPFRTIAHKNHVSVLLIHHLRKSEGDNGTAHRGSGALLAGIDIGLELKYSSDHVRNRRTLTSKSRFIETPDELMIEWDGCKYKSLGDPMQLTKDEVKKRFLEALSDNTYEELEEIGKKLNPPSSDTQLREVAKELRENGAVDFEGKGVKGSPYKYKRLPSPMIHSFLSLITCIRAGNEYKHRSDSNVIDVKAMTQY